MDVMHKSIAKHIFSMLVISLTIVLTVTISVIKYRSDEVNYLNSDATWHTLLTIEAYNETPISQHLFLPIISLGGAENKSITWGSTIPDSEGNYYYTSFSPAGFVAPWLFFKVFHLPVSEKSLYLFNSMLYCVSTLLWTFFLLQIYVASKSRYLLAIIGSLTYALAPELLHGMGIVYWHQSLMQVTLLIQFITFWYMEKSSSKAARVIFFFFAVLNPYIEWTGYVANVGFALYGLLSGGKSGLKKALKRGFSLFCLSVFSFSLFCGHYLLRVDGSSLWSALRSRSLARGLTKSVGLAGLFSGYIYSFLFLWALLTILIVWNFIRNQKIELSRQTLMLMFLFAFPLVENIVMLQHALDYKYDRMKGAFLLSFLICECVNQLITDKNRKGYTVSILLITCLMAGLNLKSYMEDETYIWPTNYRVGNQTVATYINENYPDSILATKKVVVRGYLNLLFMRGIYEFKSDDDAKEIASSQGKRYAIIFEAINAPGDVDDLTGAIIYNLQTGEAGQLTETDGILTYSAILP